MDKYTELEKQAQKFLDETDTMQFSTVELLTMFYNHQEQLRIGVVSQQRELLLAYNEEVNQCMIDSQDILNESDVDEFMANNCGMRTEQKVFNHLIETIVKNSENNIATITDVKLWEETWQKEMELELTLSGVVEQSEKLPPKCIEGFDDEKLNK